MGVLSGSRWFQRLIALLFVLVGLTTVLMTIYTIICCPLWWPGAPRPEIPAEVKVVLMDDPISVTTTASFLDGVAIWNLRGELVTKFRSAWAEWAWQLLLLLMFGFILWILRLLDRIVNEVVKGHPFTLDNARRLRTIGLLVVFESLLTPAASYATSVWLVGKVEATGVVLSPTNEWGSMSAFLLGSLIIIIAEAFRHGAAMREEQELTV